MESLRILPNIKSLIEDGREEDAVEIIEKYIDCVSYYLKDVLGKFKGETPTTALCLSRVYFVLQDYEKAIGYAIKAGEAFRNDGSFYFQSVVGRMMDLLVVDSHHPCREFVIGLIQKDVLSDSYIGFLYSVEEYEKFEVCLKIYLEYYDNPREFLRLLLKDKKERIYRIIGSMWESKAMYEHPQAYFLMDSLVFLKEEEKIREILHRVEDDVCHDLCFYLEDVYQLKIETKSTTAQKILTGEFKRDLLQRFLTSNNLTSFRFLDSIAKTRSPHVGFVNALMNLGSTNDTFYRSNSDLLGASKDWAKFNDVAYLGMIHLNNPLPYEVLKNYLPSETNPKEGGALLALGLINRSTRSEEDSEFLLFFLDGEITQELAMGACLGLGLINMASNRVDILKKLLDLSKSDNTVISEAAVYGLGLVALNSSNPELLKELEILKNETEFERVKRTIGIAYSLILSSSGDSSSNGFLDDLLASKDPLTRFGGVLALGSSYVGSGDLEVISRLLDFLNDGDDDVRRSTVIAISLVSCEDTPLLIKTLEPLAENHNSFVRAVVALCLGFFNAGTGNSTCCDIVEALIHDSNSLVRQSACIAMGFLLMQCNPFLVKNYKRIIDSINRIIVDRCEESCVKHGAVIGRGISEAGGRNIIFSIRNMNNKITPDRVAGAILFLNHWYWYPLMPLLALNYLPTPFYVFDSNLQEVKKSIKYSENYDNHLIRLPDVKRTRGFKQKPQEDKEVITKALPEVESSTRCTMLQQDDCGIEWPGIFFNKK